VLKLYKKLSLEFIGFLHAAGIVAYCGMVGIVMLDGEKWFGNMNNYAGPMLVLTLFVTSGLVTGLIAFGYPIILFWDEKKAKEAMKLVAYTAGWLVVNILLIMFVVGVSRMV